MKTKILFLLHLPPPVHGSSMVGLMIKESKELNETFDCRFINLLASANVKETGKITFKKAFGFIVTWFEILLSTIKKRPDVCYFALTSTGAAFYKDVLYVTTLKFFGVKCIYHLHNKGINIAQNKKLNHILYQHVFKSSEVILLSDLLYEDVAEFVNKKDIHICHNGIPDNPEQLEKKGKEIPQILFLSNLIESKGVVVLLDACKMLRERGNHFFCKFIGGEGDLGADTFKILVEERGITNFTEYVGKKFGREKEVALRTADIFAFPTHYPKECFPLVLLEAMQASLALVSTYEGGIPDIVKDGENGFLVHQKDATSLAHKLEILINDPQLIKKMGYTSRKYFENKFTQTIFEKNLIQILSSVV